MLVTLAFIISVGVLGNITGSELKDLSGPFAVCSEGHFFHGSCYSSWGKSCPTCRIGKEEIVEVCNVRLNPSDECAICTDKFDVHVDQEIIVGVAAIEKRAEKDFVSTQEAVNLIKCYLDICNIKKRSISPQRVVSIFCGWGKRDRELRIALRENYLKEASSDPLKEALIRRAKDNAEDLAVLKAEMEQRRSDALEAAATISYPKFTDYIGDRLTRKVVIELLDDRVY